MCGSFSFPTLERKSLANMWHTLLGSSGREMTRGRNPPGLDCFPSFRLRSSGRSRGDACHPPPSRLNIGFELRWGDFPWSKVRSREKWMVRHTPAPFDTRAVTPTWPASSRGVYTQCRLVITPTGHWIVPFILCAMPCQRGNRDINQRQDE
jgi:hypothetical protein